MSVIRKVWKLLLKKDFYSRHKSTIPASSFDEIGQELLPTLELAHNSVKGDLTEEELFLYHCAENATLTTSNKNTIDAYLQNVSEEADIKPEIAEHVYAALWRREVGRYIAEYGTRLADGDYENIDELSNYMSSIGKSLMPEDFDLPVDTDPIKLFTRLNEQGKWTFNVPTIDRKIGKISPGMFVVLLARPETGKTATIVNLIAGREGFAAQGAKTHLICNEEMADRTAGRAASCYNQVSVGKLMDNPELANTQGWNTVRKNLTFLHKSDISIAQLENYCKAHTPDVLIIDQLDHLATTGNFDKVTDKVGAVYRKTRELASKYNCVIIGISQASAEGENRSKITFSMAENSKTGKAAAADLIVGIGKVDESTGEEGNCVIRHYHVSKNKLNGWHGNAVVKLIQDESRLVT